MDSEPRLGPSPLLLTRIAMFVAVGIVVGLALAAVPNVELVSAVCFMAGFLLGPGAGVLVGGLTEALFAGFHPMGSSFGVLLLAQSVGMALTGLTGAFASWLVGRNDSGVRYRVVITTFGFLATLVFDILTNLAYPLTAGFSVSQTTVSLAAAVPFVAVHLLSNTVAFLLVVAPLLPRLQKALTVT